MMVVGVGWLTVWGLGGVQNVHTLVKVHLKWRRKNAVR